MQIGLFLKKFEKILHDKDISKKIICEVLTKHLVKEFKPDEIKVFKGVLYVNKDVFIKNAILFKKDRIIQDFKTYNLNIEEIQ